MGRARKIDNVVISLIKKYPKEYKEYQLGDSEIISFFLGETLKEVKSTNIKETKNKIIEILELN